MAATALLWKEISSKRRVSADGKHFIPASDLRTLCKRDLINNSIAELSCADHERIGLAAKVFEHGIITFSILVWMKRESSIVEFRNHDVLDASLPLHEDRASKIAPEFGKVFATEVQWQFLPYIFRRDMCDYHRVIDNRNIILPVLKEEPLTEGGFGEISNVTILSCQQELLDSEEEEVRIIRKRMKIRPFEGPEYLNVAFQEEIASLKLLHRLRHPNIVPLLGSYTHNGNHNLLFPCLDMDMSMFFRLETRFGDFIWDFMFVKSIHGLASALKNVHGLRLQADEHGIDLAAVGYHHDIRPANILVTKHKFLLADFSLAKMKPGATHSQTIWKAGVGDYIAPECMDEEFLEMRVGRQIDIWAFACLILEVVTYMEQGPIGLKQFRLNRLSATKFPNWYDQYFFDNDGIKPTVLQWAYTLIVTSKSELIGNLVELALSILKIDPKKRPTAAEISGKLENLDIKFHLRAVREAFSEYLGTMHQSCGDEPGFMNLWFENERVKAIGEVFDMTRSEADPSPLEEMNSFRQDPIICLRQLFDLLKANRVIEPKLCSVETQFLDMQRPFNEKLRDLVQSLVNLLPVKLQKRMEMVWEQNSLNTTDVVRLENMQSICRSANRQQYERISVLAAIKSLRLQFLQGLIKGSPDETLVRENLEFMQTPSEHLIATYRKECQVLVEWVSYSPKDSKVPHVQRRLLMELKSKGFGITPKPSGLRTLDCIGVIEDGVGYQGYGFLFAFPEPYSKPDTGLPVSLWTLLHEDLARRSINFQPLLGAKFRLASVLVNFLKELHMVGWLHEDINSENIIFFGTSSDLSLCSEAISAPYVVGFEKSRPDSNMWHTDGPSDEKTTIYHHPQYKKHSRFIPAYDYYSMGLVLLEIGLWTPLKSWTDKYPTASPQELRLILLRDYVPRLGQKMGMVYRDIVSACLSDELCNLEDSSSICEGQNVLFQFLKKVIEPLDELVQVSM